MKAITRLSTLGLSLALGLCSLAGAAEDLVAKHLSTLMKAEVKTDGGRKDALEAAEGLRRAVLGGWTITEQQAAELKAWNDKTKDQAIAGELAAVFRKVEYQKEWKAQMAQMRKSASASASTLTGGTVGGGKAARAASVMDYNASRNPEGGAVGIPSGGDDELYNDPEGGSPRNERFKPRGGNQDAKLKPAAKPAVKTREDSIWDGRKFNEPGAPEDQGGDAPRRSDDPN